MGNEVIISIDAHEIHTHEGASILEAAQGAGIYIPRLCFHPDLPPGPGTKTSPRVYRLGPIDEDDWVRSKPYEGCNICVVEIEGRGVCPSCATRVENGMIVHCVTDALLELRKKNLARILALHPHACLLCSEKDGCDRDECTEGTEKCVRCCSKFDLCEFQRLCEYVTIKDDVSQYVFRDIPATDAALFTFNPNLCVGCTRCVRACEKTQGKRVISFTFSNGEYSVGTMAPSYKASGCAVCGACVAVCPTGALADKGLPWKKKEKCAFSPVVLPPEEDFEATEENIGTVSEMSGVYQLLDEKRTVIYIRGADNIRADLREKLQTVPKARFFRYEEHGMYTTRENELLERFFRKNNILPEVNNEISDLY